MPAEPDVDRDSLPFTLQDDEVVIQVSRKHWWFLWPVLGLMAAAAIIPVIVFWWVFGVVGADSGIGSQVRWGIVVLWLGYWGVRMFLNWYRYNHDIWVITNQRLVDSLKSNPFNLKVSSADLVNVQDISVERAGILRTWLDFGDIVCQTSSTREVFRLGGLPNPRATQALIDQERDRERLRFRGV